MKSEKEARQRQESRIQREQEEHSARERRLRKDDEAARVQAQNRSVDALESMRQVCLSNGICSLFFASCCFFCAPAQPTHDPPHPTLPRACLRL